MIQTQIRNIIRDLRNVVADMLDMVKSQHHPTSRFLKTLELLKTLPLSTSEFGTCRHRIQSALNYVNESEFGAASFELRTVLRSLETKFRCDELPALIPANFFQPVDVPLPQNPLSIEVA